MLPLATLRQRWRTRLAVRGDQGETAVSMAIVFPFVLLVTVAVVQASMWYYARQIALTAAREGVTAARAYQAGPGEGAARAQNVLARTAGDSLRGYAVSAGSTGQRVQVRVSGTAQSMIPGLSGLRITQSASGPVERWTNSGE
ncbi:TadE family protein [Streptomyces sp. NPDC004286]|uniref:TadE family protein n=1 Tax=Streptomyces sp. NPDC004286 TaxID=3364696 RepID=UPI0036A7B7EB